MKTLTLLMTNLEKPDTKELIPQGEYNIDEFSKWFPERYKQMRLAGLIGCGVGENVTFTVRDL